MTPLTPFASKPVRDALERAGVLVEVRGELPDTLAGITDDSRQVTPGSLFVAVRGTARDGHDFLAAIADRASAAIVEDASRTTLPALVVSDARRAAPIAASVAYGEPGAKLRLIGVTGTNGKTTTVGMLRHLLDEGGARRSASIGTLGVLVGSEGVPQPGGAGLTTPGPIELQRVLCALLDAGVTTVAMEVSSHSLDQRRVDGLAFDVAGFTNLTRDHLDYHGTMDAYVAAKARLVDYLTPTGTAVINADDDAWQVLARAPRQVRFSLAGNDADVRASGVRYTPRGSEWVLETSGARGDVRLPLVGDFNVANALAAAAAAWALGMPNEVIAARLSSLPQVPGRLERIHERPTVLRDYAHTPDALERALMAVRPFAERRLLVVFGCGGDRDRGKRPEMGAIAERLADHAIVTSDNPRTEDPDRIIADIEAGMPGANHERITDRYDAIARALTISAADDVIVLAGKGHETYQIRGTIAYPFDEREIVRELTTDSPLHS
ncbi:MAG TPA: UDP-N-acetylmuramoyl-L-alanyl-D-glutamate--2,6-diaminopimelate ligase [Gemmatimonadaceae bacterium]|nr:UDP-N-acetylmuramoyl-L-alanyl-D-glutamate--2,6-diaminopimelate ligase [Gemmatimonadaceae bacterium]